MFLIAYGVFSLSGIGSQSLVAGTAAIFILPYFLFSGIGGELADKYPKNRLIVGLKVFELACSALATLALFRQNMPLALVAVFLLGTVAALFGPVKYSILPEIVSQDWLLAANAHIESGTFIAILLGTIAGGLLSASGPLTAQYTGIVIISLAIIGLASALFIPYLKPAQPDLKIDYTLWRGVKESCQTAKKKPRIWLSVLLISWFWLIGSALLALLPILGSTIFKAEEAVVTIYMAIFCVGIGGGTILAQIFCRRYDNYGLIPLGALLMGVVMVFMPLFIEPSLATTASSPQEFFANTHHLVFALLLFLTALFGGLFTVPLYTILQRLAAPEERSRVVAANNIINAIFMVLSALLIMAMEYIALSIKWQFLILALLQIAVALLAFHFLASEFDLLLCRILAHSFYNIRVTGLENLPPHGPAIFISNHVTFVDWLFLTAFAPTPPHFAMYKDYFFANKLLTYLLRQAGAIPIAPTHEDKALLEDAFFQISVALKKGDIIGFFPEGKLTRDGHLNTFRTGIERIIAKDPAPVYPFAICGLWGSRFSRHPGPYRPHFFRRRKIEITIGQPILPQDFSSALLEEKVINMLSEMSHEKLALT